MPTLSGGRLLAERRGMAVYRFAMFEAVEDRPVTDSPTMNAFMPSAANLMEAIIAYRDTLDHLHPLAKTFDRVTQFIRTSPQTDELQTFLQVTPEWVDQLFRDAMALEIPAP